MELTAAQKFLNDKNYAVFGIFDNKDSSEMAIEHLKKSGFRPSDISIKTPDEIFVNTLPYKKETKAAEGAITGVITGALLGGTLGWLFGSGAIGLTEIGPLIAAGPLLSAIASLAIGAIFGAMVGSLIGYGIPEYEAPKYEDAIKEAGIFMTVHCDDSDWANKANKVLEVSGAKDIAHAPELDHKL